MSAGQVSVGAPVSRTTILALQELRLVLFRSVAVQLTELVPLAKVAPLVGAQLTVWPGQLSAPAEIGRASCREKAPGAVVLVTLDRQGSVGASVSSTANLNMKGALVMPLASVE